MFHILACITLGLLLANPTLAQTKKNKKTTKTTLSKKASTQKKSIKADQVHYNEWKEVIAFQEYMVSKHQFDKKQLEKIFQDARYIESAIQLMKPAPPGQPKNWKAYRERFVESKRINAGLKFWNDNEEALKKAEKIYGVPANILVGLIGVETFYGTYTGNFRVFDALTTLAFSYPDTPTKEKRMAYFQSELEHMLLLAKETGTDVFSYKGSYAGAIGLPQFMPSSIRAHAIDFDQDGKIDLRESPADAIGSVANYLVKHGWDKNLPLAFPATMLDETKNTNLIQNAVNQGLKATFQLSELSNIAQNTQDSLPINFKYGLIDLQNGFEPTEYWLVSDNFYAITYYNRSYFYAMSVIDLGKQISIYH